MNYFYLVFVAAVAMAAPRDKRFAVSTVSVKAAGGATGCVVTGNVLYANGMRLRELTAEETGELEKYREAIGEYKTAVKAALEEKKEQWEQRHNSKKPSSVQSVNMTEGLPAAPTKPSFCTPEQTTQYYFDGCLVQNNKVYVGREYARDLTESEISELKEFDKEQTVYQAYVQQQVQSQFSKIFHGRDILSSLFGFEKEKDTVSEAPTTRSSAVATTEAPPIAPKVPDFCTVIY